MDSSPPPLALQQTLSPPKPQPTIQSPPKDCSNRLEGGGYRSSGQAPGAGCGWGRFCPPVPSTCHMQDTSSTLRIWKSWRSTQLSLFPSIATLLGFASKKQAQFPNWVQAAVCLLLPTLNHGWENGDKLQSYSQGRSCHHQHCRDGPETKAFPSTP